MKLAELQKLAKPHRVIVIDRGNGHFQLQGKLLVNYYPNSKKQSAYVAGTISKHTNVSAKEAVKMTQIVPEANGVKDQRRKSYSSIKRKIWNNGCKKCHWCGAHLTLKPHEGNSATLEHIIPLYRGGLDNRNNMTLACAKCNHSRGNNMPELNEARQ